MTRSQDAKRAEGGAGLDPPRHEIERDLLLEVSQAVTSTLDLDAVLQIIADGTAQLIGVETTAVYLIEGGDELYLGATTPPLNPDMPESLRRARRTDHPHINVALTTGKAVFMACAADSSLSPAERAVVKLRQLKSVVILPFFHGSTAVGVLIVGTTSAERTFDACDVALCQTLTNQLAVGVQNARLHTQLKTHAAELERRIEEQARLSEQLRQAQKMEAIGQLAGGVAHDFNNLLQVVHGFTELARAQLEPGSKARRSLDQVLQATERARVLVSRLLAFGRRQPLAVTLVDLNQVVCDFFPMLRPVLGTSIEVETRCDASLAPVRADPNQLEQVLINLCVNARDALTFGGALTIATGRSVVDAGLCAQLGLPAPGSYVLLSVSDTGPGMDPEVCRRATEPFFTTKEPGKGTGLGLSTVHGIVAQHGGAMRILSELGRGTTIEIYLPTATDLPAKEVVQLDDSTPGGTETVLVAEDDEMVRTLTRSILESAGYSVLTASDGDAAVRLAADPQVTIDLGLLDVVMPKLSGEEACRQLRRQRDGLPVVFVSGYLPTPSTMGFAQREGIPLLQKPYGRRDLLRVVRTAIDGARNQTR